MTDPRHIRSENSPGALATGIRKLHQVVGFIAMSHLIATALGLANARELPIGVGEALVAVLCPAIAEELLFRGVFFEMLRRLSGASAAVVGSAALFGLVHSGPSLMLAAGLLGLQLGAMRLGHGLSLTLVAHLANNAVAAFGGRLTGAFSAGPQLEFPAEIRIALAIALASSACAALAQDIRRSKNGPLLTSGLQHIPGLDD